MTMKELAELVEKATGPDRELDVQILLAVGVIRERDDPLFYGKGGDLLVLERDYYALEGSAPELPYPTASLDAAMTLVPEGWAARVENWPRPHGQADMAHDGGPKAKAVLMECLMIRIGKRDVWGFHTPGSASVETRAATPALALCAAALKVRASRETTR